MVLQNLALVVFLLFSCVGRGIPKIVLPDLENPEVLDALVQILTGDEDTAASDLIDETTAFDLEGEDAFSFSIQPQEGIEITVIFREQVQPFALLTWILPRRAPWKGVCRGSIQNELPETGFFFGGKGFSPLVFENPPLFCDFAAFACRIPP
jgi:hypothetical protein